MSDGQAGATVGDGVKPAGAERDALVNSLRFERAKNQVLLEQVVALEDEVVNRCMADFDAVVSDDTRDFWREQLLSNREAATAALTEMQRCRGAGAEGQTRRPLHNRAIARPTPRNMTGAAAAAGETDDRAARIRNRAHEISKAERVPFSTAFSRAERELSGPASAR